MLYLVFLPLVRIALGVAGLLLPQMPAYQTDFFKRRGRRASESAKDEYVRDSLSSRLSVSKALGISFFRSYRFLIYYIFYLVGLARQPLFMGLSWPEVFLLDASGRTGRFFTQLLFHDPHFS